MVKSNVVLIPPVTIAVLKKNEVLLHVLLGRALTILINERGKTRRTI